MCLDLCAGRGGFSSAFRDSPDWTVMTVDINPRFKPDLVIDLVDAVENPQKYGDFWNLKPDVILANPPCERWSIANSQWPQTGIYQASKVLGAVLEIIAVMKPKGWVVENPKGRMRWFLLKPWVSVALSQFGYKTVKPTDFWTNIDIGLLKYVNQHRNPAGLRWGYDVPTLPSKRAEMPYGLSKKFLESFEEVSP